MCVCVCVCVGGGVSSKSCKPTSRISSVKQLFQKFNNYVTHSHLLAYELTPANAVFRPYTQKHAHAHAYIRQLYLPSTYLPRSVFASCRLNVFRCLVRLVLGLWSFDLAILLKLRLCGKAEGRGKREEKEARDGEKEERNE